MSECENIQVLHKSSSGITHLTNKQFKEERTMDSKGRTGNNSGNIDSPRNIRTCVVVTFEEKSHNVLTEQKMCFSDFDKWVRGRFGIDEKAKLAYFNKDELGRL